MPRNRLYRPQERHDMASMDRDALVALARSHGLLVGPRWRRSTIVRKIEEKFHASRTG